MQKKVLLIGGAGTLGGATYPELLKLGFAVDVIALEDFRSVSPRLRFVKARADVPFLEAFFRENPHYDAIVDFIHSRDIEVLKGRADLIMAHTDQYVFLSSYRTYADTDSIITEESPKWIDVTKDETFLREDNYAIPKSKGERYIASTGRKNWTVIRPLISFSHYRLDLVTVGGHAILFRPKAGKRLLLPADCRDKIAGVGWAGNVGRQIARLIGNDGALGEAFTLGTGEEITWGDVASYYAEYAGCEYEWVSVEDYLEYATPNTYMDRQMIYTDRLLSRKVDLSKMLRVTGLEKSSFMSCRDAVAYELAFLSEHPDLVARFDDAISREIDARTDRYFARDLRGCGHTGA